MRINNLYSLSSLAALAVPLFLATPTLATQALGNRPLPPLLRDDANHLVGEMINAVKELNTSFSKSINNNDIGPSIDPAVQGLGDLGLALADGKTGLIDGRLKINDVQALYKSLTQLDADILPVATAVGKLKVSKGEKA
jgi:hypothetical protein